MPKMDENNKAKQQKQAGRTIINSPEQEIVN